MSLRVSDLPLLFLCLGIHLTDYLRHGVYKEGDTDGMIETISNFLTIRYVDSAFNHFWKAKETYTLAAGGSDSQYDPGVPRNQSSTPTVNSMVYYILPQEPLTLKSWIHSDTRT